MYIKNKGFYIAHCVLTMYIKNEGFYIAHCVLTTTPTHAVILNKNNIKMLCYFCM
jgi:hypothetical protein